MLTNSKTDPMDQERTKNQSRGNKNRAKNPQTKIEEAKGHRNETMFTVNYYNLFLNIISDIFSAISIPKISFIFTEVLEVVLSSFR